jgi:hypothetical protein
LTISHDTHSPENDLAGSSYAEFSNAYERRIREDGAAIGAIASSDLQLEEFCRTLTSSDDMFQKAFLARDRRHDLHLVGAVACFLRTASLSPGYLQGLIDEAPVSIAQNAASLERGQISAIIRMITSQVTSSRNVNVRVSRLSKTAVGLILSCEQNSIPVHLGNIDAVIDVALSKTRSFFQKLVDDEERQAAEALSEAAMTTEVTSPPPQEEEETPTGARATEASQFETPSTPQPGDLSSADGSVAQAIPLAVNAASRRSQALHLQKLGLLSNETGIENGVVVLIGAVTDQTILVRGPIDTPLAKHLLIELENELHSAA